MEPEAEKKAAAAAAAEGGAMDVAIEKRCAADPALPPSLLRRPLVSRGQVSTAVPSSSAGSK